MSSLINSIIFRLKLIQIIFTLGSIVPVVFIEINITLSMLTSNIVYLTIYSYLGIGFVIFTSLCISEPVSEKVSLYSSCLAVFLHLISAVFVIKDLFGEGTTLWGLKLISGLFVGANSAAFGWEVLYAMKLIHR